MARIRPDQIDSWTSENPILEKGELGYEIETSKAKLGDGVTPWNDLQYWSPAGPSTSSAQVPDPATGTPGQVPAVNESLDAYVLVDAPTGADTVSMRGGIVWNGGKSSAGTQGWVTLGEGQGSIAQAVSPPHVLGAGAEVSVTLKMPTFSAGTITIQYAELSVSSTDGSQIRIIGASSPPVTLESGTDYNMTAADWVDGDEWPVVGSDLTLGESGLVTTAGGVFVVGIFVEYTASGLVA